MNLRTENTPGSYFGVDLLGDRLFVVDGYCLRGRAAAAGATGQTSHALVSWQLQGCRAEGHSAMRDEANWVTLDEQTGNAEMKRSSGVTLFFGVETPAYPPVKKDEGGAPSNAFRAFRIIQAAKDEKGVLMPTKNSSGSFNLSLAGIELYGQGVRGKFP